MESAKTDDNCISELANELRCAICLSLAKPPIARLRCCHSFCRSCLHAALKQASKCPLCNSAASGRDTWRDSNLDTAIALFAQLDAENLFFTQLPAREVCCSAPQNLTRQAVSSAKDKTRQGPALLQSGFRPAAAINDSGVVPSQALSHPATGSQRDTSANGLSAADHIGPMEELPGQTLKDQLPLGSQLAGGQRKDDSHNPTTEGCGGRCQPNSLPVSATDAACDVVVAQREQPMSECHRPARAEQLPNASGEELAAAGDAPKARSSSRLKPWVCQVCTFQNAAAATACEMCTCSKRSPEMVKSPRIQATSRQPGRLRMPKGMSGTGHTKRSLKGGAVPQPARPTLASSRVTKPTGASLPAITRDSPPATRITQKGNEQRVAPAPELQGSDCVAHIMLSTAATASSDVQEQSEHLQPGRSKQAHVAPKSSRRLSPSQRKSTAPRSNTVRACNAVGLASKQRKSMPAKSTDRSKDIEVQSRVEQAIRGQKRASDPGPLAKFEGQRLSRRQKLIEKGASTRSTARRKEEGSMPMPKTGRGLPQQKLEDPNPKKRSRLSSSGWGPQQRKWMLLASGLSGVEKAQLRTLADLSGCRLASKFESGVTHIICGQDEHGQAKRTLKFILGVLNGKWMLNASWVASCLEKTAAVDEEEHEACIDTGGRHGGAVLGRLQRGLKLLKGWEIYLHGTFTGFKQSHIKEVVQAAGAKVLGRLPPPEETLKTLAAVEEGDGTVSVDGKRLNVVLVEGTQGSRCERPKAVHGKWEGVCVVSSWLMDSASNFSVQSMAPYLAEYL